MSRFAVSAAAMLLAVIVFSGVVVWDGLAGTDGFTIGAAAPDGYYINEFRRGGR